MRYDTTRAIELGPYEDRFDHIQEDLTLPRLRKFVRDNILFRSAKDAPYSSGSRSGAHQECALEDSEPIDLASHERSQIQLLDILQEIGEMALAANDRMQTFILSMPSSSPDRGFYRYTLGV